MVATINEALASKVLSVIDAGLVAGLGEPVPGKMCVEAAVCYAMGLPHSDEPTCVSPALRHLKINLNDAAWSSDTARTRGLRRLGLAQLGSAGVLDEQEFARRCSVIAIQKYVPIALRIAASAQTNIACAQALTAAAKLCSDDPSIENANAANAAANAAYAAANADAAAYAAAAAAAAATYAAHAAAYAAAAAANAANAAANADAAAAYAAAYAAANAANAAADAAEAANAAADAAEAADAAADAAAAAYAAAYAAANAADAAANAAARDSVLAEFGEDVVQILIEMKAPGTQWLYLTEETKGEQG